MMGVTRAVRAEPDPDCQCGESGPVSIRGNGVAVGFSIYY